METRHRETDLGRTLFEARESKGWSQERLSRESGVSRVTISKWESGQVETPKMVTLRRLANALDVPVESLLRPLGAASPDPSGSSAERRMAAELEAHTELAHAARRLGREMAEREDLYAELAEAVAARLGDVFEDGFEHYHTLLDSGVSEDDLDGLAAALMELVLSVDALMDAAVRREQDPTKRGRLVDFAARRRRQRPEIPRSVA